MNIFILDENPKLSAQYHNDIHVSKMLLESCQLLCSVFHLQGITEAPYKLTHKNHPCAVWCRESSANFEYLLNFAYELANEYTYRSKIKGCEKIHKSEECLNWCMEHKDLLSFSKQELTPFAICINNDEYPNCIVEKDPITSYRNYHSKYKQGYYRKCKDGKKFIEYKWTGRDVPEFMKKRTN